MTKKPGHKKTGNGQEKGGKKGGKKRKTKGQGSSAYQCMLHSPNKNHSTEDCYALKNLVKGAKNGKEGPRQKKPNKSEEINALMTYVKKCVAFKKDKEAEAACEEDLNNFKHMSLDDLPKDGKIGDAE